MLFSMCGYTDLNVFKYRVIIAVRYFIVRRVNNYSFIWLHRLKVRTSVSQTGNGIA